MAHRTGGGRGGRGRELMGNFGDGIKNDCKSNENRNEIKRLSEEVTTLYDKLRCLQCTIEIMDCIPLENSFGAPHWSRANLVRFEHSGEFG